jgi:hypothetical protein
MSRSIHFRLRLACLIAIGAVVNLAEPRTARAAPAAMCGGCVSSCPSDLLGFCDGCSPNGPTCNIDSGCGEPFHYLVLCTPI